MSASKEHRDRLHFARVADRSNAPAITREVVRRMVNLEMNPRKPLPPRDVPSTPSKAAVRRWMRLNGDDYETATELAEGCNAALDLPQEWLDDSEHWVWEIAAQQQKA